MTREQLVTILHRYLGEPTGDGQFTDQGQAGAYAQEALSWAASTGVCQDITSAGAVQPGQPIHRWELACVLHRTLTLPERDSKTLVAYFSRTGKNYGVGVIEKGNTHIIADMIVEQTGGKTFEIATVTPYPDNYNECTEVAQKEKNENARPELTATVDNMADYDVIFLGYPGYTIISKSDAIPRVLQKGFQDVLYGLFILNNQDRFLHEVYLQRSV